MIFQLGGMLLLKAPGYRMVEGNSQYVNSYAYSLEKGAQSRKSFYYPMCKLGSSHNPTYYNVGKLNMYLSALLQKKARLKSERLKSERLKSARL